MQQGSQRHDETPIVPTKAKLSHSLMGGSASDFGMDSMFESSKYVSLSAKYIPAYGALEVET